MSRASRVHATLIAIATALMPAAPALAWSELGHRVVAELAERQLSPATRETALRLLGSDDKDVRRLADVAAWADQVRDEPAFAWSKPMHFVNLPADCSYEAQRDCRGGDCIVMAIERFHAELADAERPDHERAVALKFLVHFVGDVHQPLHAGFQHDLGGNRHQLSLDGRGTNLHAVWDRDIPAQRGLEFEAIASELATDARIEPVTLDPAQWAMQACALIETNEIYPPRRRISTAYLQQHLPLADAQLQRAGARLAAMIEQALAQ